MDLWYQYIHEQMTYLQQFYFNNYKITIANWMCRTHYWLCSQESSWSGYEKHIHRIDYKASDLIPHSWLQ